MKNWEGFKIRALKRCILFSLVWILLVGCSRTNKDYGFIKVVDRNVEHVHGLGYTGEKEELFIATHVGLVKYSEGTWYETTSNNHDYMGFQATDDGFYSSGHPEKNTEFKNPFGLIKSTDEGKSFEEVDFYGETDFHFMAVGYYSHAYYVINEQPNSKLYVGLFYSWDNGKTWSVSRLSGLTSKSISKIATHPTRQELVGISTKDGLFYSSDNGNNFNLVTDRVMVTSLYFEEESLLFTSLEEGRAHMYDLRKNDWTRSEIPLPELSGKDAITEISSNPKNRNQMVLITQKNDIFLSNDRGKEWRKIANEGKLG